MASFQPFYVDFEGFGSFWGIAQHKLLVCNKVYSADTSFTWSVSDALGTAQRKVLTHFAAGEGNVWRQTTFFLLPLSLLLGYLCAWIVKNGNVLLATIFLLGLVALQAVTGGTAALGWGLCLFGAEALLIVTAFYRGRGCSLRTDGKATVSAIGSGALILCKSFLCSQ